MADHCSESAVHLAWLVEAWQRNAPSVRSARAATVGETPTHADLVATENIHGLPSGKLTSLADYLWMSDNPMIGDLPPWVGGPRPVAPAELADLIGVCTSGRATSRQWWSLAWALVAEPRTALTPTQATALAEALVLDLPRGIKHCYRQHRVAAVLLASLPEMAAPLVTGIRGCIDNPEGPAFLEPIGLLVQVPAAAARDLVLDLLERPRTPGEGRYAGWLATQLMLAGAFDLAQRSRLAVIMMAHWRTDRELVLQELVELTEVLPDGLRKVFARARGTSGEPDERPLHDLPDVEIDRVMPLLLGSIKARGLVPIRPGHSALRVLLVDALCRANSEARHRAGQVLSASPYRPALADGLLDVLTANGPAPLARRRAVGLLANLVDESHRLRLVSFLDDRQAEVMAGAFTAFGHVDHSEPIDQELRQRLPADHWPFGRPCMYALGMSGSEVLASLAASRKAPTWQQESARWWLRAGPAIRV